ncbi:MAG: CDP-alcohol phosphatidyltransferase family protein [Bacteroidales bacterium]|nr:CDP-alcohol phosphatidyltransferase family protein [Bacteroidales bacterium]
MFGCIRKSIPNGLTCLNLFCGCVASVYAFNHDFDMALLFIALSAVFDFLDGMAARVLKAFSLIGKDLDSLADDVSFGFAPSVIVFSFMQEIMYSSGGEEMIGLSFLPYVAFLIAVFSALRLAKFNNDTRQTSSFVGLPVPANALFWASLVAAYHDSLLEFTYILPVMIILVCFFSYMLVSEIPMFSLKFKSLRVKDNLIQYIFLLGGCLPLLAVLQKGGIAAIIVWYILLSVITQKKPV